MKVLYICPDTGIDVLGRKGASVHVREMIAAGKTDDEIRTFMVDRYGDFVLYKPRMTPGNYLLWAAPVLLLLLGTFVGIRIIRKQAAQADTDGPEAGQS